MSERRKRETKFHPVLELLKLSLNIHFHYSILASELERNNLRNAFFNSNEIMEQRVESFKYSVKIESSYFAAGT
jgi:hypothetical protein